MPLRLSADDVARLRLQAEQLWDACAAAARDIGKSLPSDFPGRDASYAELHTPCMNYLRMARGTCRFQSARRSKPTGDVVRTLQP